MTLHSLWNRLIGAEWNIAIADIGDDLRPVGIRWMHHSYSDRWFADPFLLQETQDAYIILAEEYLKETKRGRICRLTVSKEECQLVNNDTLLELENHLSFPNFIAENDEVYVYPENNSSGKLILYRLTPAGLEHSAEIDIPMIDPVILKNHAGNEFYLFGTLPEDKNGSNLHIFKAPELTGKYQEVQIVSFGDNVARRAGRIFEWNGKHISPAQICNRHYGEGISLQEVDFNADGTLSVKETARMEAESVTKMTGFHTFNIKEGKVAIDGYKYGSRLLHDCYFKLRGLDNM